MELHAPAPATRPTIQPVSAETFSLRVTVDAALKRELDKLTELLSHKVPTGDLAAVLREAVACAVEKHGKRRGEVRPARTVTRTRPAQVVPAEAAVELSPVRPRRDPIPADLRRQVHERDGGRCTFTGPDGHRCESRWQLEVDHVVPVARGGGSDLGNLRLVCRVHTGCTRSGRSGERTWHGSGANPPAAAEALLLEEADSR